MSNYPIYILDLKQWNRDNSFVIKLIGPIEESPYYKAFHLQFCPFQKALDADNQSGYIVNLQLFSEFRAFICRSQRTS